MMIGKGFDTHSPTGPWIVTPDELGDPQDLAIRTRVNDELRQAGRTSEMIVSCVEMIEHLSTAFTLEPGELITTVTPAGVAAGGNRPRWLRAGDTVSVEIEGISTPTNPAVDELALGPDGGA